MRFARLYLAPLAVAVALGCGDAPTAVSSDGARPRAVIDGVATGDRYGNVPLVVGRVDALSPWVPFCTGTLIGADVVLTAGHCQLWAPLFEGLTQFGVTFADRFTVDAPVIRVTEVHMHPDFAIAFPFPSPGNPLDFHDLAVLRLERKVDVVPATLPPEGFLDRAARPGGHVTFVGFGLPDAGAPFTERGTRRVGSAELLEVDGPMLFLLPDPSLLCIGDSGGPALLGPAHADRGARGVTMIVGVGESGDCATFGGYYRIDTPQARSFLGRFVDLPGAPVR